MYCRWLYNALLEQRITAYKKCGVSLTFYFQKKELSALKKVCEEYKGVHSQILQNVVNHLDKVYQAFFRRLKRGEKAGFPLAKSIVDAGWNQLVQFTTYKAESASKRVVLVDPRNTSQQCSSCDEIVKKHWLYGHIVALLVDLNVTVM